MSKCKFKVGDKVIGNAKAKRYGTTTTGWTGVVTDFNSWGNIQVDHVYWVDPDCFDLYARNSKKIVITTDGAKTTTAKLYEDGKPVKTAEANCAPEDTFDFMVGAKLACERLTKKEAPKPKYYNGKVVCVKSAYDWFVVGKVYEVKDGLIKADNGRIYPQHGEPYRDAEDVRQAGNGGGCHDGRHNYNNEFIPLVED